MSTTPEHPEYLESGTGRPLDPKSSGAGRGGAKKGLLIGGGVAALALVGVGAWAAVSFFATGAQPAEALPAATLGYLSVDLDPSGGQKIEALRTLNKFPAFEDGVGIDTNDDVRKAIFDEIEADLDCAGLDYGDDIEPWLGDRAAVAAVDTGAEQPSPVFVLQVKDADQAEAGLAAIKDCAGEDVGWSIDGDWAVVAETDKIAEAVTSDAAAKGSLADDEDFQKWTDEAGDSGIVAMYAAPALGDYLAGHADDLLGFPYGAISSVGGVDCAVATVSEPGVDGDVLHPDDPGGCATDESDYAPTPPAISDETKQKLEDFQGAAGVLRLDDGDFELELVTDAEVAGSNLLESGDGGNTISTLPGDTALAIGVGFSEGWFRDLLGVYAPYLGGGEDLDTLLADIETETGLSLPEDIETVFGDSAALAVSSDFDPESFFGSTDGSDVPVALKVDGDPAEIEAVLAKLRDRLPPDETIVFDSDSEGDTIVIGPNADYRQQILEDGDLGDNDVFQDVVREADNASLVFFVNVNEIEKAIADALGDGDDTDVLDNLEPISGFGVSGWVDNGVSHSVARLTTD